MRGAARRLWTTRQRGAGAAVGAGCLCATGTVAAVTLLDDRARATVRGLVQDAAQSRYAMAAPGAAVQRAFAWGSNQFGQLGLGSVADETVPVALEDGVQGAVTAVSSFGLSAGVVDAEGNVYTFGRSLHGSIGQGESLENSYAPVLLPELSGRGVRALSMGEFHMAAIDADGALWTAGRNWAGELGRADGDTTRPARVDAVPAGTRFADVACGRTFTAAVAQDGTVFTCGSGRQGVLGLGDTESRATLTAVDRASLGGERAVQVAAGQEVLLVLTESGAVYACGNDDNGKLGLGGKGLLRVQPRPQRLPALRGVRVAQLACGDMHCACVDDQGRVYVWGAGNDGQLGNGKRADLSAPTLVHALQSERAVRVACGGAHTLVATAAGELFAFGKGRNGQLGADALESVAAFHSTPRRVHGLEGRRVLGLAAGRDHSLCVAA